MTREEALRLALVSGPLALAYAVALVRRPSKRVLAGVLLSLAWNVPAVLFVNLLALRFGWWSFAAWTPELMGVPLEPWLGWAVLWGAAAPLAAWDRPLALGVVAFVWADLLAMPALQPWVVLGDAWLAGEAVAVALAFVPGILIARWTVRGEHLRWRVLLQAGAAGGLLLWLIPSIVLEASGGWVAALDRSPLWLSAGAQLLLVPVAVALRAVVEFVDAGRGTPIPYDPPRRLVRTGPYAYLANPMQTAIVLVYLGAAATFGNAALVAAAGMAFLYGAGLADWHEDVQLEERFGREWRRYRLSVRSWVPRLRPAVPEEATLLVAFSCGTCSSVGRWFAARDPVGLVIAPAEDAARSDPGLRRVTYVAPSGRRYRGVAAIARALEHVHLGWALAGWVLALPGVVHLAQLIADVCGPGPQDVAGRAYRPAVCSVAPRPGRNG
ncbi:MAG: isoprenylcysteine carboxylmethyltransferase family protein [Actinomycetota bacterium]|nr:isoprenylcysteine carboxylmethyltransferase family protein [Actinomycetota bacterium]